jgi:hypothetical protein
MVAIAQYSDIFNPNNPHVYVAAIITQLGLLAKATDVVDFVRRYIRL